MSELEGRWLVRREAGLLPPIGVTKRVEGSFGSTLLFGVPVGRFRVVGETLQYLRWPIRDELRPRQDGSFEGRARIFGLTFCRFTLVPLE